ncbi:hypothetical protein OAG52_04680 [Verrucomicrobia bacterium]|nr:hypothetical protein [Verrucomicrobiota bacterium]
MRKSIAVRLPGGGFNFSYLGPFLVGSLVRRITVYASFDSVFIDNLR